MADATGWALYQDGQNPRLFIELHCHDAAAALSDPPPQTDHYLATDVYE